MKNITEIEKQIKDLTSEIDEMHKERNDAKDKYGGISEEENESFFADIAWRMAKIEGLQWVLN